MGKGSIAILVKNILMITHKAARFQDIAPVGVKGAPLIMWDRCNINLYSSD